MRSLLPSASSTDDAGYALCIPVGCDGFGLATQMIRDEVL
jgi:hypothetical protein